jgi:hypothetical protein
MKVWLVLQLVIGAALSKAVASEVQDDSKYLYRSDPAAGAVVDYTGTGEDGDFEASTQPRVVEFYSPYCVSRVDYR